MKQLGFLDLKIRFDRIDKAGDPLIKLNDTDTLWSKDRFAQLGLQS